MSGRKAGAGSRRRDPEAGTRNGIAALHAHVKGYLSALDGERAAIAAARGAPKSERNRLTADLVRAGRKREAAERMLREAVS